MEWVIGMGVFALIGGFKGAVIGFALAINIGVIRSRRSAYVFIGHKRESQMFKESIAYNRVTIAALTALIWIVVWVIL